MVSKKKKVNESEEQVSFSSIEKLETKNNEKEVKTKTRKRSTSSKKLENKEENNAKELKKEDNGTVKKTRKKKSASKEDVNENKISTNNKATNKTSSKTSTTKKKAAPKKDRKINISQEDMDKLCEVYDWYLSVKDTISYNAATEKSENKEFIIEEKNIKDTKRASINVDRQVWEDFDVICSNLGFKKNEVLTQIIKDFLREHRNLF
ncbi:DNA-binding protein [Peptacetobacter sp.]|uniref:DNA-binding protein n=1 Tax=Peptacetobacter sp. TaxID=2991975 RepID=UPI002608FB22|nr:DNA-binding protein [Peptacetobacter sp.]